ncbi:hypothetical protein ASPBRDRAFT_491707 [Aspergillus brasiliensis CBS 101740]|uniref:Tryptophan synthase beta chain-like PALP domain-containing protein n=1 Tax=Aspergillus brasiliensis (strain CBS 101740 / IMI 381727 / IBT 21946) TaxID=767769 RepID=A0A1L9UN17_ASPBC|nr:hypothetical protein ASPBRDRAFT_491707 [Aspergillus brasiliensis CBS 101740]
MAPYLSELLSDSVAEHIGSTPLVRLNRLPASVNIKAKICAKLEYFNASGSVKRPHCQTDGRTSQGRLVREEGILCGGSSGAAFAGLLGYLRMHPEDNVEERTIVLIFPDSLRNYLTTFGDDSWMERNGFAGRGD